MTRAGKNGAQNLTICSGKFEIKQYLRLSSFELAFVRCESGALSTEPLPRGTLTSCCTQYLRVYRPL